MFLHLLVAECREGINDDTENDVETDCGDDNEEAQIEKGAVDVASKAVAFQWDGLHSAV